MLRSQLPKIKGYHLLGVAGRGQFGRVLCAYHIASRSLVALKELDKYRFPTHKLLRELRFLIGLDHPNIAKCFTLLHTDFNRYLVLEYCEAGTLRDLMQCSDWLTGRQRIQLVIDLLKGLAYAHKLQIVHCDVKPENVLLQLGADGWVVKVSDFGIAHLQAETEQHSGSRTGSPAYMAPERFYGKFSLSSDLYAVGIILYELFTQERPFQGSVEELMTAHLNQRLPNIDKLPAPLQGIVLKALAKLPAQRYDSAEAMILALEKAIADLPNLDTPCAPATIPAPAPIWQLPAPINAMTAVPEKRLLVAIANQLQIIDLANLADKSQWISQKLLVTPHLIQSIVRVADYLFVQTGQALLRCSLSNPSDALSLYQTSQENREYTVVIAPNGSWFAIASGSTLEIRSLRHRKSCQLILPEREITAVQALDNHYLICAIRKLSDSANRLVFLTRRGHVLGKLALPQPAKQIVKSYTPYRVVVLLATAVPALLLVDLLPYRALRIPLPFAPRFGIATVWGYAIASDLVLMLLDLMGQSIGNIEFPEPIVAVAAIGLRELAVAEGDKLYVFNITELGVDLIF